MKTYLETSEKNTNPTLLMALEKSLELKCPIVLASTTGAIALAMNELIKQTSHPYPLIIVSHVCGFKEGILNEFDDTIKQQLKTEGIPLVMATHALSAGERSLSKTLGGVYPLEIVANTLRMFSQGIKVCVEISLMACDAGHVLENETIIAIGGTGRGADSACVITAHPSPRMLSLNIQEILCMPR